MKAQEAIDQEILALYHQGQSEQALKLFVNQYQTKLFNLSYSLLGNYDDAMDALQESLIQVNRSLLTFQGKSSLYTWAYRLSTNVCLNYGKKKSRTKSQVEWSEELLRSVMLPVERPNEDPDKMCETKYKQFLVQQALLKLPETQRTVVVLHDLESVSMPQIASILKIELTAVKARLHRGRAALKRIITKGFEVKGMEGVGSVHVSDLGLPN